MPTVVAWTDDVSLWLQFLRDFTLPHCLRVPDVYCQHYHIVMLVPRDHTHAASNFDAFAAVKLVKHTASAHGVSKLPTGNLIKN